MASSWKLVVAVIVLIQTRPTRNSCLSGCLCSTQVLDCSNTNFTNIPFIETFRGELYTVLNMSFNFIRTLEENSFTKQYFSVIETLDLSNCDLSEINSFAFRGLGKMINLNLANNSLKGLKDRLFEPLVNLKELYLQGNQLSRIVPVTLSPLRKLIVLDMNYNRLSVIDKETFNSLRDLRELRLKGNAMRDFAPETFSPLESLQSLELQLFGTSKEISSPPSKTGLSSCLCQRITALGWCQGRNVTCFVTCDYSHENNYDGDYRVCSGILNGLSNTEATKNRSLSAFDLSWAFVIIMVVILILIITLIILALVVLEKKIQTGDANTSVIID
ncbi:chondroadherin-like protein [Zootermopsis nevadensis]|uniref:Relaxin receptor 1 n=1 Tax=Zootermopsis nevadensis TaxID=136037 RepID=A0A067RS01_ZOONE|nr:chondroadherin-like protein [Zootermopsis nevadensis]KDR22584.1 Relaxin receptor 1 [Zootermopsis nevadensis]